MLVAGRERTPAQARRAWKDQRVDAAGLTALLAPEGWALLSALPPYDEKLAMVISQRLRDEGLDPVLVAAALTQSRLRAKGHAKLGDFADGMLFTQAGLEQATRLEVGAHHARRYRDAVRWRRPARDRVGDRRDDGRDRDRQPSALPGGGGPARRRPEPRPLGRRRRVRRPGPPHRAGDPRVRPRRVRPAAGLGARPARVGPRARPQARARH